MYTLLSGLYRYVVQKDEFFVLILGLNDAGKTTLLEQTKTIFTKDYRGMSLSKITATVGLNLGKIDVGRTRLSFWDLGGQEELQSLWDKYYAECHAIIYVVDSVQVDRIEESVVAFRKMISNEHLNGVPLLLLANKQDLPGSLHPDDIKDRFKETQSLIGARDMEVMAVSALQGNGVHEGIKWVIAKVNENAERRPPTHKDIN